MYYKIRTGLITTFTLSLLGVILASLWIATPLLGDELEGTIFGTWIEDGKTWIFALGWIEFLFGTITMIISGIIFIKKDDVSINLERFVMVSGIIHFIAGGVLMIKGIKEEEILVDDLIKNKKTRIH